MSTSSSSSSERSKTIFKTTSSQSQVFLQFRPEFARSLPIQILSSGIVLTLVAVLLVHLIFTAQIHRSLAQVNYFLQLAAVVTLLVAHTANLHIALAETERESRQWPYMLSYAAVHPNPSNWQIDKRALWCLMFVTTTSLIQITHIQFLTLLYPSRLEVKLIYWFLIPITVTSGALHLLELLPSDQIQDIASTGRHICNAAIYFLFTVALFSWGCIVNVKRAWRFDGGTALFGAATLSLALFSTTLYILYVAMEHMYMWLSGLLWTVVVWQSFLGWWWWVGAGSASALSDLDDNSSVKSILHDDRREKRRKIAKKRTGATGPGPADGATVAIEGTMVFSSPAQSDNLNSSSMNHPGAADRQGRRLGFPRVVNEWFNTLKKAHRAAAREQTAEQTERIMEMERGGMIPLSRFIFRVSRRTKTKTRDGWEDEPHAEMKDQATGEPEFESERDRDREVHPAQSAQARPESIWWRGPLRRWRLHDVTSYA